MSNALPTVSLVSAPRAAGNVRLVSHCYWESVSSVLRTARAAKTESANSATRDFSIGLTRRTTPRIAEPVLITAITVSSTCMAPLPALSVDLASLFSSYLSMLP